MPADSTPASPVPAPLGKNTTPVLPAAPPNRSVAAVWQWLKRAADNFSLINGTTWSSSFAYYAFFALVPLVLLLVTLSTDVGARFVGEQAAKRQAFDFITGNIPMGSDGRRMINTTIQGVLDARGRIGLVAAVGLLWSSLGFFQSLVSAVNQAWGVEPLNWWKLPLKNLLMVGVLASALLLGNLLPTILKIVLGYVKSVASWTPVLLSVVGALVPPLVLFYGFVLFYKLAPRARAGVTFGMVWMPALIVTALLVLCQQVFVVYTTHITNFNAIYGAFGGVIALMLWIYLSGLVVVFGGCLCATWKRKDAPPAPVAPA